MSPPEFSALPLGAPALLIGLVVLLLALAAWWARRGRWRSRRAVPVAAVLLLVTLAVVNNYFAYLPRVGDLVGPRPWPVAPANALAATGPVPGFPTGGVVHLPVPGAVAGERGRDAYVYLPPQYFSDPHRRFPVVYLFHGSPGIPLDWLRGGQAAQAGMTLASAGHPAVLVMPRLSRSWLDDPECVDGKSERAETFVVHDLIPWAGSNLPILPGPGETAFAGMSAGGFCALTLALRHPDLAGAALAMSPTTQPTHAFGPRRLFGPRADLGAVVASYTPEVLLRSQPDSRAVRLLLDMGTSDGIRPNVLAFAEAARLSGAEVSVSMRPGGHTFHVWRPALPDLLLRWAAEAPASAPESASKQ